jgi:hypothetical protein
MAAAAQPKGNGGIVEKWNAGDEKRSGADLIQWAVPQTRIRFHTIKPSIPLLQHSAALIYGIAMFL